MAKTAREIANEARRQAADHELRAAVLRSLANILDGREMPGDFDVVRLRSRTSDRTPHQRPSK